MDRDEKSKMSWKPMQISSISQLTRKGISIAGNRLDNNIWNYAYNWHRCERGKARWKNTTELNSIHIQCSYNFKILFVHYLITFRLCHLYAYLWSDTSTLRYTYLWSDTSTLRYAPFCWYQKYHSNLVSFVLSICEYSH